MAVKKETLSYIEICNNVKAGKFEPIYVLMGEESYYIDQLDIVYNNHYHYYLNIDQLDMIYIPNLYIYNRFKL